MDMTETNFASGQAPWDKADLFFLFNALARGMSIQDLAGFLNRSEDEVRQQAGMNPFLLLPTCCPASATVAQRTTDPLSQPHRVLHGQGDEPEPRA